MKRESRFITSYFQDEHDELIVVLKDTKTEQEYLEIVSEKGIALTPLQRADKPIE